MHIRKGNDFLMKRTIKCIVFVSIFLAILMVLSKVFIPKNNTLEAGIGKRKITASGVYTEPENTIDVIVLGDSESYTSFIPLELWNQYGFTSYVCGTPAQRITDSYSILNKAFKRQKPKLVIMEANSLYTKNGVIRHIRDYVQKYLPIFEYHDRWKNLSKDDFLKTPEYTEIVNDKGYRYSNKSNKVKKSKRDNYMEENESAKKIPSDNVKHIKEIKKLCDKNGAKFMLYNSPTPANWSFDKHNGVEKVAKDLGVEYIDFNLKVDELKINWKKDSQEKRGEHLNYGGALKITNYLGIYLKENNELPDHRQDEKFEAWNEAYRNFQKETEEL